MTTEKDRGLSSILKAAGGGDPGARDRLFDLVFSVGWDRKLDAQDRKGLEGLLSYMERPPVSLRRLTYRRDGPVQQGTKMHPRLGIDHQLVTPVEFLALLVHHGS